MKKVDAVNADLEFRAIGTTQKQQVADAETLISLWRQTRQEHCAAVVHREHFFDAEELASHRAMRLVQKLEGNIRLYADLGRKQGQNSRVSAALPGNRWPRRNAEVPTSTKLDCALIVLVF